MFYKSVQLIGYADGTNIMGRTKRAISEECGELNERANEVGLNTNVKKKSNGAKPEIHMKTLTVGS